MGKSFKSKEELKDQHRFDKASGKLSWLYHVGSTTIESDSIDLLKDFVCDITDKKVNAGNITDCNGIKITAPIPEFFTEFLKAITEYNSGEALELPSFMTDFIYAVESDYQAFHNLDPDNWEKVHGEKTKQQLIDAVIEDLKKGFEYGDYTVLDELLNKLSVKTLVQSLPEEQWKDYDHLNNSYFEVISQDFNEDAGREEIQIHAGENGNVYLHQDGDKLGFIVDVFGQYDLVDTMPIWDEDLNDEE